MLITYPYRNNLSAYAPGFVSLEGRHTRPNHSGDGRLGCSARGRWRGQATAPAGGNDTTACQISHVIYRGHFSRCPKNVAIPTVQIRYLNESLRNYVRNCGLAAIAGHQGNVLTNISREGPTGAEGAGGAAGPGCGARGPPTVQPGPTAGPGAQKIRGSTSNNQRYTATRSVL